MFLYYKNSVLACILSIIGSAFAFVGVLLFFEGEIEGGVSLLIFGIPLFLWGKHVSENKAFKTWWKQITDANLETQIQQDINVAINIYNKNPQSRTLEKIAQLNPAAAMQIRNSIDAKKK